MAGFSFWAVAAGELKRSFSPLYSVFKYSIRSHRSSSVSVRPMTAGLPGPGVPSSEWPGTLLPLIADPSLAVVENSVSPLLR
jgi:hypothetical protein